MKFLNYIKFVAVFLTLQCLTVNSFSQDRDAYEAPGKFYFSPDFGLVLGNYTSIEVAPAFGYHITPRFSAGIGGRYEFLRQLDPFSRVELIRTDIFGIRGFSRLNLIPDLSEYIPFNIQLGIFAHAEIEALSLENEVYGLNTQLDTGRFWHTAVLAGGGISQQAGPRSFVNILFLWDLTNSSTSPYLNPIIRFGIQIYF